MLALAAQEEILAECELSENSHPGVEPFFEEVHPGFKLSNLRTALEKGATFTESRIGSLYGARYYDPVIGRFITPDDASSDSYMYANNNPLTYVDPSGHFAQSFGGVSMNTVWDPRISGGGGFPSAGLTMPPSWSVPSFMNASSMGPRTYTGLSLSFSDVNVVQGGVNDPGGNFTATTTGMVSGNEAMALYYRKYGSFFSSADIRGMTWDRSRFWDIQQTMTSGTVVLPGPQIPSEAFSPAAPSFDPWLESLRTPAPSFDEARFIRPPGYWGRPPSKPTPSEPVNQAPKSPSLRPANEPPPDLIPRPPWWLRTLRWLLGGDDGTDVVVPPCLDMRNGCGGSN